MADRCTGHCCRRFFLPFSPDELKAAYFRKMGAATDGLLLEDIDLVWPMVRFIEQDTNGGHFYSCRHLQPNGDCGIYSVRPAMCRDYPYGASRNFQDCTWDAVTRRSPRPRPEASASP